MSNITHQDIAELSLTDLVTLRDLLKSDIKDMKSEFEDLKENDPDSFLQAVDKLQTSDVAQRAFIVAKHIRAYTHFKLPIRELLPRTKH